MSQETKSEVAQQESEVLFDGLENFENWSSLEDEINWSLEEGKLICSEKNSSIHQELELPNVCRIRLTVAYTGAPDFIFGFGVPGDRRELERLVRIESWEDSLVINAEEDFGIVYENVPKERMQFDVLVKRIVGAEDGIDPGFRLVVCDQTGKQLVAFAVEVPDTKPGIFLQNKSCELLTVEKLTIESVPDK
jgi:hypothetical protein